MPPDYVDIVKESIIAQTKRLGIAQDLITQEFLADLYAKLTGVAYISIPVFYTYNIAESPDVTDYQSYVVPVSVRDRPVTDETRIEVIIGG